MRMARKKFPRSEGVGASPSPRRGPRLRLSPVAASRLGGRGSRGCGGDPIDALSSPREPQLARVWARDHACIDPADAHRELAGETGGSLARTVEDEELVAGGDLAVELAGAQRRRIDVAALVAQVLRGELPATAGGHPVTEGG